MATAASTSTAAAAEPKPPQSLDEWQALNEREDADILDSRPAPDYDIAYKQSLRTEDIYLQMGAKTAATASCEEMVLTIRMPAESAGAERIQLDVTDASIDLQSPQYRLRLALPQRVDPDAGTARYDPERRQMVLRLRMVREFDYVNF